MSYYKVLGLEKEPFSTSPDPQFFYESGGHKITMTNLLIELRLRRGLSVILGDVGTGKTTLSRKLVQSLKEREGLEFHMIFDPTYDTDHIFLSSLIRLFGINLAVNNASRVELKEALEHFLYERAVEQNKTVVLIIDEAQKLENNSLELLRVLLNYETNEYKLLQVVLLGQLELHAKIMGLTNFMDRVSFKYTLNPLDEEEMKEMINFRLGAANYQGRVSLFQPEAVKEIYHATRGYPRQVTLLCHKTLKNIVMNNKTTVDAGVVREIVDAEIRNGWVPLRTTAATL